MPAFLPPISSLGDGRAVAAGDLNHDGRADIAVVGDKNAAAIGLSNGDGTFRSGVTLTGAQGYYLNRFRIGDVNADGHPDVVVDGLSPGSGSGGPAGRRKRSGHSPAAGRRPSGSCSFSSAT